MNREDRRRMGISKETSDKLEQLNTPCTVLEAVQLAQGVSEDAISNYHKSINPIIVSLSIQVEVLKELLFRGSQIGENTFKSIISEEEFIKVFKERVEDYNKQKEEAISKMVEQQSYSEGDAVEESEPSSDVKTNVSPFPVQVDITKKES